MSIPEKWKAKAPGKTEVTGSSPGDAGKRKRQFYALAGLFLIGLGSTILILLYYLSR